MTQIGWILASPLDLKLLPVGQHQDVNTTDLDAVACVSASLAAAAAHLLSNLDTPQHLSSCKGDQH